MLIIKWLTDWVTDWLTDWLIDWFIHLLNHSSHNATKNQNLQNHCVWAYAIYKILRFQVCHLMTSRKAIGQLSEHGCVAINTLALVQSEKNQLSCLFIRPNGTAALRQKMAAACNHRIYDYRHILQTYSAFLDGKRRTPKLPISCSHFQGQFR